MAAMFGLGASNANAVVFGLTFEGVGNTAAVDNFYNGGQDSFGNVGPDFDITFNEPTLALKDRGALQVGTEPLPNGNFENEPSPDTVMYFLTEAPLLTYAPGFQDGFSFFYSSNGGASVEVYDNLTGTGDPLGTILLASNWMDGGCATAFNDFCNWDVGMLELGAGVTAMSIKFLGIANQTAFDNITFGSASPVPLPAAVWLLGSGLLGFAALRRRRSTDCEPLVSGID